MSLSKIVVYNCAKHAAPVRGTWVGRQSSAPTLCLLRCQTRQPANYPLIIVFFLCKRKAWRGPGLSVRTRPRPAGAVISEVSRNRDHGPEPPPVGQICRAPGASEKLWRAHSAPWNPPACRCLLQPLPQDLQVTAGEQPPLSEQTRAHGGGGTLHGRQRAGAGGPRGRHRAQQGQAATSSLSKASACVCGFDAHSGTGLAAAGLPRPRAPVWRQHRDGGAGRAPHHIQGGSAEDTPTGLLRGRGGPDDE